MKKLRLIHTSDTHLGDPSGHPRAEEVLSSVVDAVERLEGDVLLLAGDVFDNERVTDDVIERFVIEMARLETPVIVLPGNHDLAHQTSVYLRPPFDEPPANLRGDTRAGGRNSGLSRAGVGVVGSRHAVPHAEFPPPGWYARADEWPMASGHGPRALPL